MDKNIRLSGIAYESLVNGPGIRRVFFSQGCIHNCKECFNPDTHDFNGGELRDMDELILDVKENPMIKGITFSGGDPFEQADKFAYMAKEFKKLGLNIWSYTGYTFEYILSHLEEREGWKELINNIDALVDGRFEVERKEDGLRFRGSSNQRIINVPESLREGKVILVEI
ncbi:anaerobic ribonucleoside-triphosphate reductase activating protein [Clostridium sp. 'White wine YQ']|uniref:anaerobic ribonucleoside-triphosphate reductase activating protein n=1 Tax=Clostridium sp. 'White wine YQ' TaxID=3027474 RepID=UPI00236700B0|nr:anaerobic ribonucleoside-triphosphate reductase activating protein [Clostridium sp. 'White wine YQ']MDD7795083.1 anaerobic ribonucleoside-triphosphate reductase activating protein [Clostridium sp. 'White wine YQ']